MTPAQRVYTHAPVLIVGTGLLGTSIGLSLRARGVDVYLADSSPIQLSLAVDYGAGLRLTDDVEPGLVIVCVPPEHTASQVQRQLEAWPDAIVTDVASVKAPVLVALRDSGVDLSRYVGVHPMAGRERSGAMSARSDLFVGRPWVVCVHDQASEAAITAVRRLGEDLDATVLTMDPEAHDAAVALVSHVPQVLSTLLAGRLVGNAQAAQLAGQGLRDMTRIAASSPDMWLQVLAMNSESVLQVLTAYKDELERMIAALGSLDAPGALSELADQFRAGNDGVTVIPGKHGGTNEFDSVIVMVDDKPGELARLFAEIGEIGINIEDLRLEHSPGAAIGLAEVSIIPGARETLVTELEQRTWRIVG